MISHTYSKSYIDRITTIYTSPPSQPNSATTLTVPHPPARLASVVEALQRILVAVVLPIRRPEVRREDRIQAEAGPVETPEAERCLEGRQVEDPCIAGSQGEDR